MNFAVIYVCVVIVFQAAVLLMLGDILLSGVIQRRDVLTIFLGVLLLILMVIGWRFVQAL